MNLEQFLEKYDGKLTPEMMLDLYDLKDHYVTVGQSFEDLGIFDESEETANDSPRLD